MKCPKCDHVLKEEDFTISIFDDEINVEYECPECEHYACIGFNQEDLK